MRKLLLISILLISIILLSGCGIYNLSFFTLPDDNGFLALVQELDTPYKIGQYMLDNFSYEPHIGKPLSPYQLYLLGKGDCDDFSNFSTFIASYHNYETYQMFMDYEDTRYNHSLAIYKENNKYNFSDNQSYIFLEATNFREIADRYYFPSRDVIWLQYTVYDYDMNIVEQVTK